MNTTITKRIAVQDAGTLVVTLRIHDCPQCGVIYGITDDFETRRRTDGKNIYCPNGHVGSFGATESDRLKKQLASLEERNQWLRQNSNDLAQERNEANRKLYAQKANVTKLKKRIANGTCPCCQRHFAHLHKHMASQHPEFVAEHGEVTE